VPHVVGGAALLKQLHPDWGPEELRAALVNNGYDLLEPVVAQGAGRLDILSAVQAGLRASPDILAFEKFNGEIIDFHDRAKLTLNYSSSTPVSVAVDIECYFAADEEMNEVVPPVEVFNYVQTQEYTFSMPANSEKEIEFQLVIPGDAKQGYYWGKIDFVTSSDRITVPFGFRYLDVKIEMGEWIVDVDTKKQNQRIKINNLTVTNGARLTLDNVTIFVNSKRDGLSEINITKDTIFEANNCTILSYNPSIYYNFSIYGKALIKDSRLSGMWGIYDAPYPGGINIYTEGSEIRNSTIYRCYTNAIFTHGADNILIADNSIHHNGGEGVLLWESDNINIIRNNITMNWWDGVGMTSSYAVVNANEIQYNSYDGIWINQSSPYVGFNTISYSGYWMKHDDSAGAKFQRGASPILEWNIFENNKYYGFYINGSSPMIWNTTVKDSLLDDIFILAFENNHSTPRFINSHYDTFNLPTDDELSHLTREWLLTVRVMDETGGPVPEADVTLIDVDENDAASAVTDITGQTPPIVATQYIRTAKSIDIKTPHRLEINKSFIFNNTLTGLQLTTSRTVDAVLTIPDLEITEVSHTPSPTFINETINLTIKIHNNASFDIPDVDVICYLDANQTPLSEKHFDTIPAGKILKLSINSTLEAPGLHYFLIKVLPKTVLPERSLENNIVNYSFRVYDRPDLTLDFIENHTYVHEPITFVASVDIKDGNITGYQFEFSDGLTTDWLENNSFQHIFSKETFVYASFRIRTDIGLTTNWSKPLWFDIIQRSPNSGIVHAPYTGGDVKTIFQFAPSLKLDIIAEIIKSYSWTFGDGASSDNATPTHEYNDDGIFNVTLTITYSTDDGTAQFWTKLEVINTAPVASFFLTKTVILTDQPTEFSAITTNDIDDSITELTFKWQFGDGTEGTGMTVTHVYTEANVYSVILTVTDDNSASSTYTLEVTVTGPSQDSSQVSGSSFDSMTVVFYIIGILAVILIACAVVLMWILHRKKLIVQSEEEEEE
jgi:parallel beta-helix repeat protein